LVFLAFGLLKIFEGNSWIRRLLFTGKLADIAPIELEWVGGTSLTLEQFEEFVLPHLSKGSRGPEPKLSLHAIFNYLL
jgi:hypothetical protein